MTTQLSDIAEAQKAVSSYIKKTSLLRVPQLEKHGRVYLACENEQETHSFKVRGAFNAMLHLSPDQKKRGVVTCSSGNFAQAVACAAQMLGVPATIIMPKHGSKVKQEGTAKYQPEIILVEDFHSKGKVLAEEIVNERGVTYLSPYDQQDVINGQGTLALEILEVLPSLEHFFCPIGGGGLMSGCATALKSCDTSIHTVGVEPEGAEDYFISRQLGKRTALEKTNTIADGLGAVQVGELNWPLLQAYVDEVMVVSELQIRQTMRFLYETLGIVSEPSGATALAGFLAYEGALEGDVVCVLSGGNVDPEKFEKYLSLDN